MRTWHIEAELPAEHPSSGANYKTFMVKDKTFETAIERLSHRIGVKGKFKLIAVYEPTELDKNVLIRVG